MEELDNVNHAINIVTMRHQTLLRAMCALVQNLPEEAKRGFAQDTRFAVQELLQDAADLVTAEIDHLVTLDTAALLEAAGFPPQRD